MTDYVQYSMPHRKPVMHHPPGPMDQPLMQQPQQPMMQQHMMQQPMMQQPLGRTPSASYYPQPGPQQPYPTPQYGHARRHASTATASSTSSKGENGPPYGGRMPAVQITLRRTTSSRSGQSIGPPATSYVALMRKQKATVWCDRSQLEDPRLAAQQRAAKQRAAMEVTGHGYGRTATALSTNSSGVRSKIRHGPARGSNVGYSPATLLVGASGVPMRLSASEVGDDEDDGRSGGSGETDGENGAGGAARPTPHPGNARSSSARSSVASSHRAAPVRPGHVSGGVSPASGLDVPSADGGASSHKVSPDNSRNASLNNNNNAATAAATANFKAKSDNVSNSSSRENSFGHVGEMKETSPQARDLKTLALGGADDLSRRGSVDERAMTMGRPRLFVANPDLSD